MWLVKKYREAKKEMGNASEDLLEKALLRDEVTEKLHEAVWPGIPQSSREQQALDVLKSVTFKFLRAPNK